MDAVSAYRDAKQLKCGEDPIDEKDKPLNMTEFFPPLLPIGMVLRSIAARRLMQSRYRKELIAVAVLLLVSYIVWRCGQTADYVERYARMPI